MAGKLNLGRENKGSYVLVLQTHKPCRIKAGRLPEKEYPPGIYFYIGRAKRYLRGRLARHLRTEKRLFGISTTFSGKLRSRQSGAGPAFSMNAALHRTSSNSTEGVVLP